MFEGINWVYTFCVLLVSIGFAICGALSIAVIIDWNDKYPYSKYSTRDGILCFIGTGFFLATVIAMISFA